MWPDFTRFSAGAGIGAVNPEVLDAIRYLVATPTLDDLRMRGEGRGGDRSFGGGPPETMGKVGKFSGLKGASENFEPLKGSSKNFAPKKAIGDSTLRGAKNTGPGGSEAQGARVIARQAVTRRPAKQNAAEAASPPGFTR